MVPARFSGRAGSGLTYHILLCMTRPNAAPSGWVCRGMTFADMAAIFAEGNLETAVSIIFDFPMGPDNLSGLSSSYGQTGQKQ